MLDESYKLIYTSLGHSIQRISDNASIPVSPENCDYMAYLRWLNAGNVPEVVSESAPVVGD